MGSQRTALVTGAGQGVGRQVAIDLAATGHRVLVNDYVADRAESVAEEIVAAGGTATAAPADVCDFDALMRIAGDAQAAHGGIDILVSNAGNAGASDLTADTAPFWESDPAEWRTWLAVNLDGVMNSVRAVLPGMVDNGYGRIVNVISDAGRVGEPRLIAYSGAKAGAAGFTRAVAKAVGRHGVTANCVALGATVTPTTEALLPASEEAKRRTLSNYIIKRFGEPEDAAAAICFLASEGAGWITSQTLPVNGGYSSAI